MALVYSYIHTAIWVPVKGRNKERHSNQQTQEQYAKMDTIKKIIEKIQNKILQKKLLILH